jgi:hypothetical protein
VVFDIKFAKERMEAWTIGKTDQKRIEAFETWCWRRVLKIKWTEKVRNEEVHRRIREERTLWSTIHRRRTRWFGHVVRHSHYVGSIMEGKIEGKAPPRNTKRQLFGASQEGYGE